VLLHSQFNLVGHNFQNNNAIVII